MLKRVNNLLLGTAVSLLTIFPLVNLPKLTTKSIPYEITSEIGQGKLRHWIERLALAESSNTATITILDVNNKHSYGCLQFQEQTFIGYVKRYKLLPEAEDGEIMNQIYDCPFQKDLAGRMIQEDYDNWRHWQNSVLEYQGRTGIGLPPTSTAPK